MKAKLTTMLAVLAIGGGTLNAIGEFLDENGIQAVMPGKIYRRTYNAGTLYLASQDGVFYMVSVENCVYSTEDKNVALRNYIYAWASQESADDLEVNDYDPKYESISFTSSSVLDNGTRVYDCVTATIRGNRIYRTGVCTIESKGSAIVEHNRFILRVLVPSSAIEIRKAIPVGSNPNKV